MRIKKLLDVYEFAKKAHKGQKRKSGKDYITHPIEVAQIAEEHNADEEVLCACLLHDVVEDTPITLEEIANKFGTEISFLVDGVTKIDHNAKETFEKIEGYAEKDKRVMLIKLADRIHNVITIFPETIPKYKISTPKYISLGKKFGYIELVKELKKVSKEKLI